MELPPPGPEEQKESGAVRGQCWACWVWLLAAEAAPEGTGHGAAGARTSGSGAFRMNEA